MIELGIGAASGAVVGAWFDVVAGVVFFGMAKRPGSWAARMVGDRPAFLFLSPLVLAHSLWTLLGLLAGLTYGVLTEENPGMVHLPFIGVIGTLALMAGVVLSLRTRLYRGWTLSLAVAFFLCFGLLLPYWARAVR